MGLKSTDPSIKRSPQLPQSEGPSDRDGCPGGQPNSRTSTREREGRILDDPSAIARKSETTLPCQTQSKWRGKDTDP